MRGMKEIYPTKVYVVDIYTIHDTFRKRLKDPYPSTSIAYYDTIKDAEHDIAYRKKHGVEFNEGDKIKIRSVPFDEMVPGIYGYPHGGRRYNKEQVKKLIAQREKESEWSDNGSSSVPWDITDEIEGRDEYEIFMNAINHDTSKSGSIEKGMKAIKEYREGIEDRKKKKSASKSKRATNAAVKAFLPTGNKIKSMKNKAEEKIKSVYSPVKLNLRKKKTATKPKRKIVKKIGRK
jgi:hypothetical protein